VIVIKRKTFVPHKKTNKIKRLKNYAKPNENILSTLLIGFDPKKKIT